MTGTDLKFHPLADMFPLMEGDEFDALVADIKANGVREPITIFEGKILDGRNRYRACMLLGIEPRFQEHRAGCAHVGDPAAYVISMNIHRRHLTAEQKRDLIAKLIEAQPEKSDRQIAKQAKASPTTVGTTRAKMEKTGEVSKLDTRTDAKGVKQPAKKKRSADAEQEEADKKECTRLWQKVQQAEGAAARINAPHADEKTEAELKIEKHAFDVAESLFGARPDIARALYEFTDDHWWPFVEALDAKATRKAKPARECDTYGFEGDWDEQAQREFEERVTPPIILEKLRAVEIEIVGLRSENDELRTERDRLRARVAELEGAHAIGDGIPECLRRTPKVSAS
jgi:hypothetical protein